MSPDATLKVGKDLYFTVPKRYEIIEQLGQGAHGAVISAKDTETGKTVAI